ncbi:MAG: phosphoglucosamine mutase [Ignavibacteria bacterium]|nr:phosphoglucosamine mutase [Ignavibacteria bacterium]
MKREELIFSVSGLRGIYGETLRTDDIIKYSNAFGLYVKEKNKSKKIVIGRDGRLYGEIIANLVISNLFLNGFHITDIGVVPTPTVQIATEYLKAAGGISITASHNPQKWNGLKFLNCNGTFLDTPQIEEVNKILRLIKKGSTRFSETRFGELKSTVKDISWTDRHIEKALNVKFINRKAIRERKFKVVVDAVNSSGSIIVPKLLRKLGCRVIELFTDCSGIFPHNPEPIPENLKILMSEVVKNKADMGIAVDPDSDRLVLITDKGEPFGEENTITTAVKHILRKITAKNNKVTVNLSTTRAVRDIARGFSAEVITTPVGEINVVSEMKRNGSCIGGEGSGGIILPDKYGGHYGRDAITGIVLILNELAGFKGKLSEYKKTLPEYHIIKNKIITGDGRNRKLNSGDKILENIKKKFKNRKDCGINLKDGIKLDFKDYWIHLRKSNTEPIIRIITEAHSKTQAEELQKNFIKHFIKRKI